MSHYCIVCERWVSFDVCPPDQGGCARIVCTSCLADARLGRMVRGMPEGSELIRARIPEIAASDFSKWGVEIWDECGEDSDRHGLGATPEEALEKAGVREVER